MTPDPALLPAAVSAVLERSAAALGDAGVDCAVGGSVLLRLLGGDVAVGDVDLLVATGTRDAVLAALAPWQPAVSPGGPEPWRSAWRIGCTPVPSGPPLDVVGGMRLRIGPAIVAVEDTAGTVRVGAVDVALSDPAVWVLVYREIDPARAEQLAGIVGEPAVRRAARRLGLTGPER